MPAWQSLADHLAARGIAALRFAYGGTGDSAGSWDEPNRLKDWVTSIDDAVLFARRAHGGPAVLVGMRMGALLVLEAVASETKVEGLVLWDPCASGREFLRVERTLLAAGYGATQGDDGSVSGPAFTYNPTTVADLRKLTLDTPSPVPGRATLVLARANSRIASLQSAFTEAGADWEEIEGQLELLDVPPDMLKVPERTIETICRWTSRVIDGPTEPIRFDPVNHAVVSGREGPAPVTERPVWLGPHRLFGMATDPFVDGRVPRRTVVFLTAGALDHTGPGRMWVELARFLAADGIGSVRIDIDGIGESYGRSAIPRQIPKPPEAIDDVVAAALSVGGAGSDQTAENVILVGLSSGGYHAVEAGLRLKLAGVAVVNGGLTSWVPEMDKGRIDIRRQAFRPMSPVLRRLAVRHHRIATSLWRTILQLRVRGSAFDPVTRVSRRGTPLLLIMSEVDFRQFEPSLYWRRVRRSLHRQGLLNIEIVPGGDHSLYTPRGRQDALPVLLKWLTARTE